MHTVIMVGMNISLEDISTITFLDLSNRFLLTLRISFFNLVIVMATVRPGGRDYSEGPSGISYREAYQGYCKGPEWICKL